MDGKMLNQQLEDTHWAVLLLLRRQEKIEQLEALCRQLTEALKQIAEGETSCCPRCEGNGRLYANGKAHYMSEGAPTIFCGNCGGSGRLQPENAQEIAGVVLADARKVGIIE